MKYLLLLLFSGIARADDTQEEEPKVIYKERTKIMETKNIKDFIHNMKKETLDNVISKYIPKDSYFEQWNLSQLEKDVEEIFKIKKDIKKIGKKEGIADEEIKEIILKEIKNLEKNQEKDVGEENIRSIEKGFLLQIIDHTWKEHLLFLDYLKQGISLRAYGQKDPLNEYKKEAFGLFENMLFNIKRNISKLLSNIKFEKEKEEVYEDVYKDQKLEKDSEES